MSGNVSGGANVLQVQVYDRVSLESAAPQPEQPEQRKGATHYVPPVTVVLRGLGITEFDLQQKTVSVSTPFLRFIISELVRRGAFDPAWYAERYPDVEGARLAGQSPSLHQHYCTQGYFEGRLPCEPPFDPDWYYSRYDDVSRAFSPADPAALRQHFTSQGWWEGRAGTPELRNDADRWLEAANEGR